MNVWLWATTCCCCWSLWMTPVVGFSAMRMMVETTNVGAGKTTVVAGATGYIGKSVVRESVRQGYNTIALVRDKKKVESQDGKMMYGGYFDGAKVVECDVCDPEQLTEVSLSLFLYEWMKLSNAQASIQELEFCLQQLFVVSCSHKTSRFLSLSLSLFV